MYVEKEGQHALPISPQDIVGSNKNYALLYPLIENHNNVNLCKWLILVYATPDKDDTDIINTVKIVLKKILEFPFNFVLPQTVGGNRQIPRIEVKYTRIRNIENENLILQNRLFRAKETNVKSIEYENVPMEEVQDLIDNHEGLTLFCKRKIKLFFDRTNKHSYKTISTTLNENGEISNTFIAKYSYPIDVEDAREETLYGAMAMRDRFATVIRNYLTNGE